MCSGLAWGWCAINVKRSPKADQDSLGGQSAQMCLGWHGDGVRTTKSKPTRIPWKANRPGYVREGAEVAANGHGAQFNTCFASCLTLLFGTGCTHIFFICTYDAFGTVFSSFFLARPPHARCHSTCVNVWRRVTLQERWEKLSICKRVLLTRTVCEISGPIRASTAGWRLNPVEAYTHRNLSASPPLGIPHQLRAPIADYNHPANCGKRPHDRPRTKHERVGQAHSGR